MLKLSRNLAVVGSVAALAAAMAFAPQAAHAADGTITITGKIITQTCDVTTGSGGNFAVTLPLVTATGKTLQSSGDTAGQTKFAIDLTNCPTAPTGVQVASFFSGSNIDTTDGNLDNTASAGATNVQVQLLNENDSSVIDLRGASASAQNSHYTSITGGSATLSYYAQYYATGTAGAGNVTTAVDYTLVYQ
ncbi:MAG: fimbrial protein [Gammaproteobacteria bacterium]